MSNRLIHTTADWSSFFDQLQYSKLVILTDSHTEKLCLPLFLDQIKQVPFVHLNVVPGESSKTIEIAQQLWQRMLNQQIDRDALVITLGGGVVCDLGGYVASNYKRGLRLINIPTTHLAMTDAALGGKNAINFGGLKNQIGTVHQPLAVWINTSFLKTLPSRELRSGWVETVKHALIADGELWKEINQRPMDAVMADQEMIRKSARIKQQIADQDPQDRGIRQSLNFGHTIGHALESQSQLLHGEAVAFGICAESYLSSLECGLSASEVESITAYLKAFKPVFRHVELNDDVLIQQMMHDKKNQKGAIHFSLLPSIGVCKVGITTSNSNLLASLSYAKDQLLS